MKICTFNVNSIKARKDLILEWLEHRKNDIDILCFPFLLFILCSLAVCAVLSIHCSQSVAVYKVDLSEKSFEEGKLYYLQFKYSEAKARFDQVIAANPNHKLALYYRGRSLIKLHRPDEAAKDFERSLQLDSRFALGFVGRAEVAMAKKDFETASTSVVRALEINPGEAEAWYMRGLLLGYQEKVEEAIESFKKCLELDAKHVYAHYHLGLAYSQIKRKDLAILHLQKFLELAPNAPEAEQVRKLLNTLLTP